ncbi:MAG: hypothetical protein MZV64_20105 [Ignavibacteriales bacterium]|nr:hypothetical protein [Ignavibacteriales bacterium]
MDILASSASKTKPAKAVSGQIAILAPSFTALADSMQDIDWSSSWFKS